jgi:hypothetical protein
MSSSTSAARAFAPNQAIEPALAKKVEGRWVTNVGRPAFTPSARQAEDQRVGPLETPNTRVRDAVAGARSRLSERSTSGPST